MLLYTWVLLRGRYCTFFGYLITFWHTAPCWRLNRKFPVVFSLWPPHTCQHVGFNVGGGRLFFPAWQRYGPPHSASDWLGDVRQILIHASMRIIDHVNCGVSWETQRWQGGGGMKHRRSMGKQACWQTWTSYKKVSGVPAVSPNTHLSSKLVRWFILTTKEDKLAHISHKHIFKKFKQVQVSVVFSSSSFLSHWSCHWFKLYKGLMLCIIICVTALSDS